MKQGRDAISLYKNPLQENLCDSIYWTMECSDLNAKFLNAARECVNLHLERGEYRDAYMIIISAFKIDPNETELMLLMAKTMQKAGQPGLKAYVKKIMHHLNAEEQEQLQQILRSDDIK